MNDQKPTIFSVSELTLHIKRQLELGFPTLRVKGEVTNIRYQSSGHIYFSLKDASSQISAVLFKGSATKLGRLPKDGDQVVADASLGVYAPRGTYQLIVKTIDYGGVGDLLLRLHQLKEALHKEGYFDKQRKRSLPSFPKTIGVVTSPSGAVIQDILHVLTRRSAGFHLLLNPVRVQGDMAAGEIAAAIDDFNRLGNVDVIIVARGGGSLEDLWPFNERCVADALFRSKIPTIAAIGHETDISIADFVADVRAPTPSAAAEIVLQEKSALLEKLEYARHSLKTQMINRIHQHKLKLERYERHPVFQNPYALIAPYAQRLDDLRQSLNQCIQLKLERRQTSFDRTKSLLEALNPKNVLKKGYCIPFAEKRDHVIVSVKQLKPSNKISLMFSDGDVSALVQELIPNESKSESKPLL